MGEEEGNVRNRSGYSRENDWEREWIKHHEELGWLAGLGPAQPAPPLHIYSLSVTLLFYVSICIW